MLNRANARLEGGHDARFAVTVGGDHALGASCLAHDRVQLLRAELLVDRVVELAENAAGGTDLDEASPTPKLFTDRLQALGHPVAEGHHPVAPAQVVDPRAGVLVDVPVPTGHAQDRSRPEDARAGDGALVHGSRQIDAESTHLPDRGEAGLEGRSGVVHHPHGSQRRRSGRECGDVEHSASREVTVAIPQAGHDGRYAM